MIIMKLGMKKRRYNTSQSILHVDENWIHKLDYDLLKLERWLLTTYIEHSLQSYRCCKE